VVVIPLRTLSEEGGSWSPKSPVEKGDYLHPKIPLVKGVVELTSLPYLLAQLAHKVDLLDGWKILPYNFTQTEKGF